MVVSTRRARQWADWILQAPDPHELLRHVSRPRVLLVLRQIATYANQDGICWPTIQTLATDTGMSRRAVQAAVRFLTWLGLIHRTKRRREHRGGWLASLTTICKQPREWVRRLKPRAGHRPHVDERRAARAKLARQNVESMLLAQAHRGAHRTPHRNICITPPPIETRQSGSGGVSLRTMEMVAAIERIRQTHRDAGRMERNSANRRRKG